MASTHRPEFLDGIEPFDLPLAESEVALVCGAVDDHTKALLPGERSRLARMGDVRRREYSSGRRVARCALEVLGVHGFALRARGRVPVWPRGIVGSITHSRCLALAMAGRRRKIAGIGVDLESERRVTDQLARRVLLEREREQAHAKDWPTMLFAAKEAVYKAVNPLIGEYLGFMDVAISAGADGTYRAAMTRAGESKSAVDAGRGWFRRVEGHWLCVFSVPGDEAGANPVMRSPTPIVRSPRPATPA